MEARPGRTIELWLLALGLLAFSGLGWLRLQLVITSWDFLQQSGAQPGPVYQLGVGAVWALSGLLCAWGLLQRWRWAPALTRGVVLGLAVWYWVDALTLTRAADAAGNWPYMLGVTLFCVAFTLGVLALNRQKRYFAS